MSQTLTPEVTTATYPQIECGSCQQQLPLRLTQAGEDAAVWLCVKCNVPFVACCVPEALATGAQHIRLHERSFDVSGQPTISLSARQIAVRLASRPVQAAHLDQRRSKRVSQSLVVPAVVLGPGYVPSGEPFQIMVANLSREGIGLVHSEAIMAEHIAIEFAPTSQSPIQVIVRLVRQRELTPPFYELGGTFVARLGSIAIH